MVLLKAKKLTQEEKQLMSGGTLIMGALTLTVGTVTAISMAINAYQSVRESFVEYKPAIIEKKMHKLYFYDQPYENTNTILS